MGHLTAWWGYSYNRVWGDQ